MQNILLHLRNFYNTERKSLPKVLKELFIYMYQERELPIYYFLNLLYRPSVDNISLFVGGRALNRIKARFHSDNVFLENKLLFFYMLDSLGFRTPQTLAYSNGGSLYLVPGHEMIRESRIQENIDILMDKKEINELFVKPINASGGTGCFLYNRETEMEMYSDELKDIASEYLFQEVIKQNRLVSQIYPYLINTLRVYTLKDNNGDAKVVASFMRFGIGGMNIDNASSGGFFVPVDLSAGILKEEGIQLLKHGGNTFKSHPDTQYKFKGFEIPYFRQILDMTIELSSHFRNIMIGWDIAIGNDEFIFIEGNSNGSLLMSQIACGGFKTHPIYSSLL